MDVVEETQMVENAPQTPSKLASIPGTPLQQISPERLNQRIPNSPSLPLSLDQHGRKSQHRLSDASEVKARIAYLNSMTGSPTRGSSPTKSYNHAAIQRAIVGREEAEAALNSMTSQLESAKARERLVSERVESLMEQLQEARNRQRHERQVYEKEVKTSKKNEYKAELVVIKLQEELKEIKNELEGYKARAEHDKSEKDKARQEAFERAYAVAGMTEELQTMKDQLQVVQQERDQAVATAASRMPTEEKKEVESKIREIEIGEEATLKKRKRPMPDHEASYTSACVDVMDLDDENCTIETKYAVLQREVEFLQRQRVEDEELIHFMNMQCQFKACPCRMAERSGVRFVHDYEYDQKLRAQNAKKRKIDDDKPLPKYTSWAQKMQMKKGKEPINMQVDTDASQEVQLQSNTESSDEKEDSQPAPVEAMAPLPPTDVVVDQSTGSMQIDEALAAAQIPLPSTSEDTAQLEEFTRVIVDPANVVQPAFTSAFASKGANPVGAAPKLPHFQSTMRLSEELFNLSPPKRAPPRPSTAMGIVSVESPIRLERHSPEPLSAASESLMIYTQSQTTRIALNDASPNYSAIPQQRSRSRPNIRDQPRGRSPVIRVFESQPDSTLDLPSPASSTVFPITPIPKHPRNESQTRTNSQIPQQEHFQHYPQHLHSDTMMTTTVPLRHDDTSELTISQSSGTVPLKDPHGLAGTPVISREAALAQIRARRDRARSVNMRKAEQEGRVDNDRKGSKTPGSTARRGVKIDLGHRSGLSNQAERGRDVSQASAPDRF